CRFRKLSSRRPRTCQPVENHVQVRRAQRIDEGLLTMSGAFLSSFKYSKISPGWQSNALQITSSVLNRIAFAFPVFKIERLDSVRSTLSESSFSEIFRFAIITSKFTIMGIA